MSEYRDSETGEWFRRVECHDCPKICHEGFEDWNVDEHGDVRCEVCHEVRLYEIEEEMADDLAALDDLKREDDAQRVRDIRLTFARRA